LFTFECGDCAWLYDLSVYNNVTKLNYADTDRFRPASAPPSAPTLVSPTNGSKPTGPTITFTWNPSQDATDYALYIRSAQEQFFEAWVGNVTSYQVSGLPNDGTQYSWRVYPKNDAGVGNPSDTWTFVNGEGGYLVAYSRKSNNHN